MSESRTADAVHLVCALQFHRLRAWKTRSSRAQVRVSRRVVPQAYSSSSTILRGHLADHLAVGGGDTEQKPPAVLWIVNPLKWAGSSRPHSSLVARIRAAGIYRGDAPELQTHLKRYVHSWSKRPRKTPWQPSSCTVVAADPESSRFYPANDASATLAKLHYVNKDGSPRKYERGTLLRIAPASIAEMENFAETLARRTVFLSYKHDDFLPDATGERPPWSPRKFATELIKTGKIGVWWDAYCAPPSGGEQSTTSFTDAVVHDLLCEGHAQSKVLVAFCTPNYRGKGVGGVRWTQREYSGRFTRAIRDIPLKRFALHGGQAPDDLEPTPDDRAPWDADLDSVLVPGLASLLDS
jgi:hypothetical protein